MKELRETIHSANLTKTQKMIGQYVLDNSADACFMTSTEIAMKLGVSESSVIRFSRSLGFSGFMDFQKSLRKDYQDKVLSISSTITVPAQRVVKRAKLESNSDYINRHFKNAAKIWSPPWSITLPQRSKKLPTLSYQASANTLWLPEATHAWATISAISEAYGTKCRISQQFRHQPY